MARPRSRRAPTAPPPATAPPKSSPSTGTAPRRGLFTFAPSPPLQLVGPGKSCCQCSSSTARMRTQEVTPWSAGGLPPPVPLGRAGRRVDHRVEALFAAERLEVAEKLRAPPWIQCGEFCPRARRLRDPPRRGAVEACPRPRPRTTGGGSAENPSAGPLRVVVGRRGSPSPGFTQPSPRTPSVPPGPRPRQRNVLTAGANPAREESANHWSDMSTNGGVLAEQVPLGEAAGAGLTDAGAVLAKASVSTSEVHGWCDETSVGGTSTVRNLAICPPACARPREALRRAMLPG